MRFSGLLAMGLVALATPAHAQKAEADAAFQRGKDLMAKGQTAEACAELETSMRLEPMNGTLYNLALCHEQLGKIASAWTELKELAANDKNAARAKDAAKRAAALEKKLTRMRIVVTAQVDGLAIKRGDIARPGSAEPRSGAEGDAEWIDVTTLVGKDVPVDPATYNFVASAPGFTDASVEIDLSTPGATIDVTIPALVATAGTDQPSTPSAIATDPYASRLTLRPLVLSRGVYEVSAREDWTSSAGFMADPFDTVVSARVGLGPLDAYAALAIHTRYSRDTMRPVLVHHVTLGGNYLLRPLLIAGVEFRKYHPLGGDIEQGFDFRAGMGVKRIITPAVALVGNGGLSYQSRFNRGNGHSPNDFGFVGDGRVQLSPLSRVTFEALTHLHLSLSGDLYPNTTLFMDIGAAATVALVRSLDAYIQTVLVVLPEASDVRVVSLGLTYRRP